MAPKKKGGKSAKGTKGGKGVKGATVVDGSSPKTLEELEAQIVCLREELDREREQRNYFQLERDKIHSFWENTKSQLEEKKDELRNKNQEIEEAEERHQVEIKAYKQKVKHLLYEQQNSIEELKTEGEVTTKLLQKEHADLENDLWKNIQNLNLDLKEQNLSSENLNKSLKLKHDEEITHIRNEFKLQLQEIEAKYEKKMLALRQEQDITHMTEIEEIEQRKNLHISKLIQNYEKAISDIKTYYDDRTSNKQAQISKLKENEREMKNKEKRIEIEMAKVLRENKQLTEPLHMAIEEAADLRKQLTNYNADKNLLAEARARLRVADKEMNDLKLEKEILEQVLSKVQQERDELHQMFTKAIQEVQQKNSFKNLLLESKLAALTDTLEKNKTQLN